MRSDLEWNLWNLENDAHDDETIEERAHRLGQIALYRDALAGNAAALEKTSRIAAESAAEIAADYRAEWRLHQ